MKQVEMIGIMVVSKPFFYLTLRKKSRKHLRFGRAVFEFTEVDLSVIQFLNGILLLREPYHKSIAMHVNVSHVVSPI